MTVGIGTLAYDVKDKIIEKLQTAPGFEEFVTGSQTYSIEYAYNEESDMRPRSYIRTGEIMWDDEAAIALGGNRRDEFFRISIEIEVTHPGDTQKEANDRVKALMQAFEAMVRNPRWSGLPLTDSQLKPQLHEEYPTDNGRGAILVLFLVVQARKS